MREVDGRARDRPLPARATVASPAAQSRSPAVDVLALGGRGLRDYHARTVSMVYQNPGAALNPSMRVGAQVAEAFTVLGVPDERGVATVHSRRS